MVVIQSMRMQAGRSALADVTSLVLTQPSRNSRRLPKCAKR